MGSAIAKLVFIPPPPTPIYNKQFLTYIETKHYTVPILHFKGRKQPPDTVILFSHGNAEDLGGIEGWLMEISRFCDADVIGYDYPGYGLSKSKDGSIIAPSEAAVYETVNALYDHLTQTLNPPIPPNKIVLFGRSLGTGPTMELASKKPDIKGVVLQSPFLSCVRVVMRTPFTYPFDVFATVDKVKKVKSPVFICHGDQDTVINIEHGKKLSKMLPNAYPPLFLEGAGHNDFETSYYEIYSAKLKEYFSYLKSNTKE